MLGKMRFPLLEEGAHPFNAIMILEGQFLGAALRAQLFLQRMIEGRRMQRANLTKHRTRPGGQPVRHFLRSCQHFGIRNHGAG